jgi:hypothetical protein
MMTLDAALQEWRKSRRRMGCVASVAWLCKRVSGFKPLRVERYTMTGAIYQHVVAVSMDGLVRVDIAPECDAPRTI